MLYILVVIIGGPLVVLNGLFQLIVSPFRLIFGIGIAATRSDGPLARRSYKRLVLFFPGGFDVRHAARKSVRNEFAISFPDMTSM